MPDKARLTRSYLVHDVPTDAAIGVVVEDGDLAFNEDTGFFYGRRHGAWIVFAGGGGAPDPHGISSHNSASARIDSGLDAALPAAAISNRLYHATDTGIVYRDTGSAQVEMVRAESATRLAQLAEKDHASLTNVTANQHHNQAHAITGADHTASGLTTGHVIRATGATTFAFAQLQHTDLGSVGIDDHHARDHVLVGSTHTASGLTTGHVVRASGATTFAFAQLQHTDLGSVSADQHHAQSHGHTGADSSGTVSHANLTGVTANQHHNQSHVLTGADHTESGLTTGHVVRASGATTFAFAQLAHTDLGGVTANQHHNQAHVLNGADHTVSGLTAGHVLQALTATTFDFAQLAHSATGSLTADDHTQYLLLAGRSTNQTAIGATSSGGTLTLQSTSNATRGKILFGSAGASVYDEVNNRLGINTASPSVPLQAVSTGSNTAWFVSSAAAGTGAGAGFYCMSSNTPTALGHRIGFVAGGVNDSGTARLGPFIGFYAAEAWTLGSAHSGYIDLLTAPTGSASNVARLRVNNDGNISVPVSLVAGAAVGTAATSSFVALEVNSTTKAFLLPRMSATQRDAMTATDGMMIYLASGTGSPAVQGRVGGAWVTL